MYVTHHLEEMFEIGDRVTVLRDGKFAASAPMREYDHDSLIAAMVGRKIESLYPASNRTIGAVAAQPWREHRETAGGDRRCREPILVR